jgi:hypothetical protein
MLLPHVTNTAAAFVAIDLKSDLVLGAGVVTSRWRPQPLPGPGVDIEVVEPYQQSGIAHELLGHVEAAARIGGAQALYGTTRVVQGSEAERNWWSLGFSSCETVREHVMPLDQFEPRLAPLVERLTRQGRIPTTAKIVPLYRSDLPAVLRLHLDHLGGDRGDVYRKLRNEGAGAFHPIYSRVLLVDEKVQGCILARRKDRNTATVDANVLHPSVRGSWANLWLKLEATRGALRLGIKNFEFTTFDHYADTRRFTEKLGGTTKRTTVLMFRPVIDD